MRRISILLISVALIVGTVGCGDGGDKGQVVHFVDPNLEAAIREAIG